MLCIWAKYPRVGDIQLVDTLIAGSLYWIWIVATIDAGGEYAIADQR